MWTSQARQRLPDTLPFLLDVEEGDGVGVPQQQVSGASVENLVAVGNLDFLGDLVLQVLDEDLACAAGGKERVRDTGVIEGVLLPTLLYGKLPIHF